MGGEKMFGHSKKFGLFSKGSGGLGGPGPMGPRQLALVPAEGVSGNGMATIGLDNTFSLLAHLPPPHNMSPYAPAVYAAYLVDSKGKNGFYAGTLRPAGNGMYQVNFRSPVPLVHFNKVVVSLESPQGIGQAPQGPIVMKVKEGLLDSLGPVRKIGGDMWGKVKGSVGSRFGGKAEEIPEEVPGGRQESSAAYQYSGQGGYQQQGGYAQGGYTQAQGYSQRSSYPPNTYGYQHNSFPRSRGLYPQGISQQRPFAGQPAAPYTPYNPQYTPAPAPGAAQAQPQAPYYSAQPQPQAPYYPAQPQPSQQYAPMQQPQVMKQPQVTQQPQQAPGQQSSDPQVSMGSQTAAPNNAASEQSLAGQAQQTSSATNESGIE
jgi:hypothetical protein